MALQWPAMTTMPTTISETALRLRRKEVSSAEITRACLERIEKLNPALNAFITVMAESALADAARADTSGVRTTAASALYKDGVPAADAEVVRRLRLAGAVIVGKNNLHEFAYGGSSLVSYFGDVRNPWDAGRIAGGSSGGSAAAVAAGMVYVAIGTDTAGSIREPAALCGCVGLKPTYGRVSTRGVVPLSASLDHVGPLAGCVADAAAVLQVIAGYDPADVGSVDVPVADYVSGLNESVKGLRVGVAREYFFDDLDAEVAAAVEEALQVIRGLVAEIQEVTLDVPADRTLQAAESWAVHAENVARSPELYQAETLRRIRTGEKVSAAEYILRRRELDEARRGIRAVFAGVDLLVTPTTPMPAPAIAELKANPEALRPAEIRLLRNTRPFNVWGLPAISVPCGFTRSGLPIGLQIAGPHWREELVLRLGQAYERATGAVPPLLTSPLRG
jgi:aspartyl-tRNA(Asn)/glutamyl-tRNA(Gln) amidotransferase subunit A